MYGSVDSKWSKVTSSDAAAIKKCWRAVLAIYASITLAVLVLAVITSGRAHMQDSTSTTAHQQARSKAPPF
jgi:hypothetical protein